MATITVIDDKTIKIAVELEDALHMIEEAESNLEHYAARICTILYSLYTFRRRSSRRRQER